MSSQLNSKRQLLDNLASLYMLLRDMQKFKPILQSNVVINILASKFVAWIDLSGKYVATNTVFNLGPS